MHKSGLDKWMTEEKVRVCRLLEVMGELDPSGQAVCRRTIYNARRLGTCDTRTMVLLHGASQRLVGTREASRALTFDDFDRWGILAPPLF